MRDIIKPAIALGCICVIVATLVAFTNTMTKPQIVENIELEEKSNREEIFTFDEESKASKCDETVACGEEDECKEVTNCDKDFKEIELDSVSINGIEKGFYVYDGKEFLGYVIQTFSTGYGGIVKYMIALDENGKVMRVEMGENSETPGLGDKIGDKKFIKQFVGVDYNEKVEIFKGENERDTRYVDAVSGATITSKSAVKAVNVALEFVRYLKEEEEK